MALSKAYKAEHYDEQVRKLDLTDYALHAVMNDLVTWGKWVSELDSNGKYRAGLVGNACPVLITQFRVPGQQDSIQVYVHEHEYPKLRELRNSSEVWQPILDAIRDAADKFFRAETAAA